MDSGRLPEGADLVAVALPGVQRFIAEARSTSDVFAASDIYSKLAGAIVVSLRESGGELVLPGGEVSPLGESGMPNRVVARLPEGKGEGAARSAVDKASGAWKDWIRETWLPDTPPVPETLGFPVIHWVSVRSCPGGYEEQWQQAQRLLAARRRVRDFAAVPEDAWRERSLCSLTPRWPAEERAPRHAPAHEKESKLSTVGWVKRSWRRIHRLEGFPSIASIASAPYRATVLSRLGDAEVRAAVRALADAEKQVRAALNIRGHEAPVPGLPSGHDELARWLAVDGGPWVYQDRWRPETLASENTPDRGAVAERTQAIATAAADGRSAAGRLRELMGQPLTSYLAVVAQDLDSMGAFLGGSPAVNAAGEKINITVSPNEHGRLSTELLSVVAAQRRELESAELLSQPVYLGGDDLLAFSPAARALEAAVRCHDAIPGTLPHSSTAVLFFHHHASIQQAMTAARALLEQGKDRVGGKHALAVGYLRRSGVSEASIQPWDGYEGMSSAELFGMFRLDAEHRLSPRLLEDLDRDAAELSSLVRIPGGIYQQELARLVRRHIGADGAGRVPAGTVTGIAGALVHLGEREASQPPGLNVAVRPQPAARVGVFLRQEAR